jgi:hypothetical protein
MILNRSGSVHGVYRHALTRAAARSAGRCRRPAGGPVGRPAGRHATAMRRLTQVLRGGGSLDRSQRVVLFAVAHPDRTQWAPFWAELDDRGWYAAAGESHSIQAWPPRPPGAAVLADPFEGL